MKPRTDIYETEGRYCIAMELPGITREEIALRIENDRLIVEHTTKENEETEPSIEHEWSVGDFRREFFLAPEIDRTAIDATMRDGLLEVCLRPAAKQNTFHIHIN